MNDQCVHPETGGSTVTPEDGPPQEIHPSTSIGDDVSRVTCNTGLTGDDTEGVRPPINTATPSTPVQNAIESAGDDGAPPIL